MRLFRRRADLGLLVLLALLGQFAASFGHVHAPRVISADMALGCRTFLPPAADRQCPPVNQSHDDCAVCWAIGIAGTLVLPAVPEVSFVATVAGSPAPHGTQSLELAIATAAFDARGPPAITA